MLAPSLPPRRRSKVKRVQGQFEYLFLLLILSLRSLIRSSLHDGWFFFFLMLFCSLAQFDPIPLTKHVLSLPRLCISHKHALQRNYLFHASSPTNSLKRVRREKREYFTAPPIRLEGHSNSTRSDRTRD